MIPTCPIVTSTATVIRKKDVLRVEKIANLRILDTIDHTAMKKGGERGGILEEEEGRVKNIKQAEQWLGVYGAP